MKNLLFFLFLSLFTTTQIKAQQNIQIEASINPIAALFGAGIGSADVILRPSWGVGADVFISENGGLAYINAKHYFNPRNGGDRFHFGTFAAVPTQDINFGIGFFAGHKWVSKDNVILDVAAGVGRPFGDELLIEALPYFKLNIGYRFN